MKRKYRKLKKNQRVKDPITINEFLELAYNAAQEVLEWWENDELTM